MHRNVAVTPDAAPGLAQINIETPGCRPGLHSSASPALHAATSLKLLHSRWQGRR